ncbi:hypothetical protein HMPREF1627_00090, partial [Actinomyces sp. S6-Spd3]
PTEFSMIATRERKHGERLAHTKQGRVLPVSAIYGANAAGKSTLIEALATLREIIIGARRPGALLPVFPHLPYGNRKPSKFTLEFIVKETTLIYELEADKQHVIYEALLILKGKQEEYIFERDDNGVSLYGALNDNKLATSYANVIAPNETYLGAIGSAPAINEPLATAAYDWFNRHLIVIYPHSKFVYLPARFDADEVFAAAMNAGLTRADTGISGLALEEMNANALPLEDKQLEQLTADL